MSVAPVEDRGGLASSIDAIGRVSAKWSEYIQRREMRLRVAKAFLYGGLVFFVMAAGLAAYVVSQYSQPYFLSHIYDYSSYWASSILLGVITIVGSFVVLRRRSLMRFKELSGLFDQISSSKGGHEEASNALAATRKMLEVLPEIARPRYEEPLAYAALASLIATLASFAAVGLFVAVAVFLYFRWEGRRNYEKELARLEEQRKVFEEKMQSFVQTL